MTEYKPAKIEFDEDDVIWAKESLKRIKAIADVLTNLERNGYTDELFDGSLHGLMGVIDHEVETAKKLLTY